MDETYNVRELLGDLLRNRLAEMNLSATELGGQVGDPLHTVKRRLRGEGFSLDGNLQRYIAALQISPDEVFSLLFPSTTETMHKISAELKDTQLLLQAKRDELDDVRSSSGPELGLVRDLASTGRWAVGVLPHHDGPASDRLILDSIRLAITAVGTARDEIAATRRTVRELFNEECGRIVRDRAVFIADSLQGKALPPVRVSGKDVIHMSIPVFNADRAPRDTARPMPKFRPESVVVLATTQGAWAGRLAALLAKALGWGLRDASSVYRVGTPVQVGDRDLFVESMNGIRNAGLASALTDPWGRTFVHHTGRPSMGDGPEEHPVVAAAVDPRVAEQLPFIILLSESDRVIRHQAEKVRRYDNGSPRYSPEEWTAWRDELRSSVATLPRGRFTVIDVDFPWMSEVPQSDRSTLLWQRTADIGDKLIKQLSTWGGVGPGIRHTGDREALKVLQYGY